MKSNRQARHILGLDHKISNQRKLVTEGDKVSVVNNPTGRTAMVFLLTKAWIHSQCFILFARRPGENLSTPIKQHQERIFEKE